MKEEHIGGFCSIGNNLFSGWIVDTTYFTAISTTPSIVLGI